MTTLSEQLAKPELPEPSRESVDLGRTYSVLSFGDVSGAIEDYTLIPIDQEGLVVVKNLVFFE
ncbi:MAG: hypothetical protein GXO65_01935 [Euryarchaeota archaeon]|nr:hypothetical protein [Euryarchaeota archaeon]